MSSVTAQSLYSRDVLRLAMALPHDDQIDGAQGSATCRAPVCGSEISADVKTGGDGRVAAVAFRARACALGQASAAILRSRAPGLTMAQIGLGREALVQLLQGGAGAQRWPEYDVLAYARDYPARHGAILLPFDALLAALAGAGVDKP
jgi:NifU-like protein involved in Fe-S cluster formation